MIIAVALTNNNDIAYSIEDTDKFKMYDVLDKQIINTYTKEVSRQILSEKISFLKSENTEILFIKTLDDYETDAFGPYSMQAFINADGDANELVKQYLHGAYIENLDVDYNEGKTKSKPPINE